jgi:hypothetical protein
LAMKARQTLEIALGRLAAQFVRERGHLFFRQ